ncbi:MAG: histidine kinase [Rhizobacter sp.]|nr:histidine kinase [Chlorobiales bacterium]
METTLFKRLRFIGAPLLGLIFWAISWFVTPPHIVRQVIAGYSLHQLFFEIVCAMAGGLAISEGCLWIYRFLEARLPWEKHALRRLFVQSVLHVLLALIVVTVSIFATAFFYPSYISDEDGHLFTQIIFEGTLMSLLVAVGYTSYFFFERWKKAVLESETLKQERLQSQLYALKAQLDPHFLFNTLGALTTLIEESPPTAVAFVERLSEVYRYVLQSRERELVPLADELKFLTAYEFLFQYRFGERLKVVKTVDEQSEQLYLPPMSLQLLFENAMKHNAFSAEKPLTIEIAASHGEITVINNVQPRTHLEPSLGIGLQNLVRRYELLSGKKPLIVSSAASFSVRLPLLAVHLHELATTE